jgi:hypothetical protein
MFCLPGVRLKLFARPEAPDPQLLSHGLKIIDNSHILSIYLRYLFKSLIEWKLIVVNYFSIRESVSSDGNVTTSVLNLMPTVNDNDAYLICRAENIRLPNQFIENGWKLHVYCKSIIISKLEELLRVFALHFYLKLLFQLHLYLSLI